jgi:hypothetical protein
MKTPSSAVCRPTRAFTLVEILLALFITGFVLAGAIAFFIDGLKTYTTNERRLTVNADLRRFTLSLQNDAAFANNIYIYDVDTNGLLPGDTAIPYTQDPAVPLGQSGDLILLVTTQTDNSGNINATEVVAYYRGKPTSPNGTITTDPTQLILPIYRIDSGPINVPTYTTDANNNLVAIPAYTLFNSYIKNSIATTLPFLATAKVAGTAVNTSPAQGVPAAPQNHPNLFYNLGAGLNSAGVVMVRSMIEEQGNTGISIDNYNLTIWPRG